MWNQDWHDSSIVVTNRGKKPEMRPKQQQCVFDSLAYWSNIHVILAARIITSLSLMRHRTKSLKIPISLAYWVVRNTPFLASVFYFILFFPIDLRLTCVCVVIGTMCNIYVAVVFSGWQGVWSVFSGASSATNVAVWTRYIVG